MFFFYSPFELVKMKRDIIVKSWAVKDFKMLNDNTYDYIYDNFIIEHLYTLLAGSRSMNATDIKKCFYHISLDENGRKYAAIRVKGGALLALR